MAQPTPPPYRFESDRLVYRCYEPQDAEAMLHAVVESYLSLRPWLPWAQEEPTLAQFQAFVRRSRGEYDLLTNFNLGMFDRVTGRLVGGTGLHRFDWAAGRFEIGYWLRDTAVGNGYVTEAVRRLTRLAFEDLSANRVEIRAEVANTRSRRVAERCGYTFEGVLRDHSLMAGTLRDLAVYSMIRSEYAPDA